MRVVPTQGVREQPLQRFPLAERSVDLVVAKTQEGRRHPADDRPGLGAGIAVIEHVAQRRLAGSDQTQRPCGRHPERVHRFAAHELAQARSQHRPAIGMA